MTSQNGFDEKDLKEFFAEASDMLDQAEKDLTAVLKGETFISKYDSVFRVFHSLKGGAGMLGLSDLQNHMHKIETIFSSFKHNSLISDKEVTYFLEAVDAARTAFEGQPIRFEYSLNDKVDLPQVSTKTPVKKFKNEEKKGSVVIVDDEKEILEILAELMESSGFECRSFLNPNEALLAIKEESPDVILSDFKMPQMSGLDFLNKVREFNSDVPLILISGFIDIDTLIKSIEAGIFSAIEKPFQAQTVITYALAAKKQHDLHKIFKRGLNLLLYQFSDLEHFLKQHGKDDIANTVRSEIFQLTDQWKKLNSKASV